MPSDATEDRRILAKVAIVLGICIAPIVLAVWFLTSGTTGLERAGCEGSGCRDAIERRSSANDRYFELGLAGAGALVVGGAIALAVLPRRRREDALGG